MSANPFLRAIGTAKTIGIIAGLFLTLALSCSGQAASTQIRVLTYNTHHGEGTDGKLDLARIAEVIKGAKPDVVALQEVDNQTQRTRKVDQAAELGRLTGLHAVFGKAFDYSGGQYGAAILSRWPIDHVMPNTLPGSPGHEVRPALTARIRAGSEGPELTLISVHLDHQSEAERLAQSKRLLEIASSEGGRPVLVAGDLNALPESPVLRLFNEDWLNPTAGQERFTIPSEKPVRQIDFILCRPAARWRAVESRVIESPASDHCALLVVLELRP